MNDIYVLNRNLQTIGIIDSYKSLIWANRYYAVGDCELYVPATTENLAILQKNNFLMRTDSNMICQIKKIELDTDAEEGNYLIVTGFYVLLCYSSDGNMVPLMLIQDIFPEKCSLFSWMYQFNFISA